MEFFGKKFCIFHKWDETDAIYKNAICEDLGISEIPAKRVCKSCGRTEIAFEHCLGGKPHKKIIRWQKVKEHKN